MIARIVGVLGFCLGLWVTAHAQLPTTQAGGAKPGGAACAQTPSIDGAVGAGGNLNSGTTVSTLTLGGAVFGTGQINTLVLALISSGNTQAHGAAPTVNAGGVVDGSSNTYTKLGAFAFQETDVFGPARGQQFVDIEIWYHLYATVQASQQVTITMSGTADWLGLQMGGYFQVNTSTPFDPNVSLPASGQGNENGSLSVSGKSTTNSCTLGVGIALNVTNAGLATPAITNWNHSASGVVVGQLASSIYTFNAAFTSPQTGTFGMTAPSGFVGSIGVLFHAVTS